MLAIGANYLEAVAGMPELIEAILTVQNEEQAADLAERLLDTTMVTIKVGTAPLALTGGGIVRKVLTPSAGDVKKLADGISPSGGVSAR